MPVNPTSADSSVFPFFLDALDLIATYETKEGELTPAELDPSLLIPPDDDTRQFLDELRARHLIVCARQFRDDVLGPIELHVSHSRIIKRQESRGEVRGRLDVPRYVQYRFNNVSLPRIYPILLTETNYQTPENALVVQIFHTLAWQLGRIPFPDSVERRLGLQLYNWSRARLRRSPWSEVHPQGSLQHLANATERRIDRHQTANDHAYAALLPWLTQFNFDVKSLGTDDRANLVQALLAFRTDEAFQDKIFEIWCLSQVAHSLERCNCVAAMPPEPLYQRAKRPIYAFQYFGLPIQVWYQKQGAVGSPLWRYDNNYPLTGIPDIIITAPGFPPFILDAKFRFLKEGATRSEETYKMLGYLENFRASMQNTLHGLLFFVGSTATSRSLTGPNSSNLTLLSADQSLSDRTTFQTILDQGIKRWLDLNPN